MELIQEPDLKITYDKCKYRVKLWEHEFKKKNNRLPSKLDMRDADKEVRFAYKTYFNLKSAALEQSFRDVDGFQSDEETVKNSSLNVCDDVNLSENVCTTNVPDEGTWGEHLNNAKGQIVAKKAEKSDVNSTFTKKLFVGSKFSKRNPRKSLSFNRRKSESNSNFPSSQPVYSCVENKFSTSSQPETSNDDRVSFSNVKFAAAQRTNNQSVNIIQSVLNNDYKQKRSLDCGWIERMAKGLSNENVDVANFACSRNLLNRERVDDSDDIIDESDDDDYTHVAKKFKTNDDLNRSVANKFVDERNTVRNSVGETANDSQTNTVDETVAGNDVNVKSVRKSKKTKPRTKSTTKGETLTKTQNRRSTRSSRSKTAVSLREDSNDDPYATDSV